MARVAHDVRHLAEGDERQEGALVALNKVAGEAVQVVAGRGLALANLKLLAIRPRMKLPRNGKLCTPSLIVPLCSVGQDGLLVLLFLTGLNADRHRRGCHEKK